MRQDPLVEEVRRKGQQYVESFKGDWAALRADLKRRAKEAGRVPVSGPVHQEEKTGRSQSGSN